MLGTILLLIVSEGCAGDRLRNAGEANSPTSLSMVYDQFTGRKEAQITVSPGKPVEVAVHILTENGSIDTYIVKSSGEASYEGRDIPTSSFMVLLQEPGTYTIGVEAKNHAGSYSFSW